MTSHEIESFSKKAQTDRNRWLAASGLEADEVGGARKEEEEATEDRHRAESPFPRRCRSILTESKPQPEVAI